MHDVQGVSWNNDDFENGWAHFNEHTEMVHSDNSVRNEYQGENLLVR